VTVNRGRTCNGGESASYVRLQPLIAVRNVRASIWWYRQLLQAEALPEHEHRDAYDRNLREGQVVLQLHAWMKKVTLTW
jgi:uncharacterized glyoxalase superfamily protein PhnB